MPIRGQWQLRIYLRDGRVKISCHHGKLSPAALGKDVTIDLCLEVLCDGLLKEIATKARHEAAPDINPKSSKPYTGYSVSPDLDKIAQEQPWFASLAKERQTYRLTASVRRLDPFAKDVDSAACRRALLVVSSDSDLSPAGKDACLVFPRGASDGYRLWTTATFLQAASAYFQSMFASGCVEAVPARAKRLRLEALPPLVNPQELDRAGRDWDDSDDETDETDDSSASANPAHAIDDGQHDGGHRQITVRESAFTTYRAVLLYLKTGYIAFAPLRSSSRGLHAEKGPHSRADFVTDYTTKYPTLPAPASPKSVYRLAHLLELADLRKTALAATISRLSPASIAYELFAPVSIAYEELRIALIKYAVKNLDAVQGTSSWKVQQEKAARGEIEGSSLVLTELLAAVVKARKAS